MIERATPEEMNASLDIVESMIKMGVRFAPVPVRTNPELQTLLAEIIKTLETMAIEIEQQEQNEKSKF